MAFEDLLGWRCSIYRGAQGAKRNFVPGETTWSAVATDVQCRLDFLTGQPSGYERLTEEITGRNRGTLFVLPTANIRDRDIVVITNENSLADKQYDVMFVNPIKDYDAVHHYECIVGERDNKVDL